MFRMTCIRLPLFLSLLALANLPSVHASQNINAAQIYERLQPSLCFLLILDGEGQETGLGSGVLLSADGRLATNAHVVAGAHSVRLECGEKRGTALGVVRYRAGVDLVVLNTTITQSRAPELGSTSSVKPGSVVFVMGNPYGLRNTITSGLVSGEREIKGTKYLQISAQVNPGNSGGPVVDGAGAIIGIATGSLPNAKGLNFAVSIDELPQLPNVDLSFRQLSARGYAEQPSDAGIQSALEFRNVDLGTPCQKIHELRTNVKEIDMSGINVLKNRDLLGETVSVVYECRYGKFVEGSYAFFDTLFAAPDLRERLKTALIEKYGRPAIDETEGGGPNSRKVIWRPQPEHEITLSTEFLRYRDKILIRAIERKEALKAIDSGAL